MSNVDDPMGVKESWRSGLQSYRNLKTLLRKQYVYKCSGGHIGNSGIVAGYDLTVGSRGNKVYQMQQQLARIAKSYPAIPAIVPDGIYGNKTKEAVEKFQSVFGLPVTGIVDYNTWYEISNIYVAVTRIAELM